MKEEERSIMTKIYTIILIIYFSYLLVDLIAKPSPVLNMTFEERCEDYIIPSIMYWGLL